MFVLRHRSQRQSLLLPLRRRALLDEGGRLRHHLQTVPVQEQLLHGDSGLLGDLEAVEELGDVLVLDCRALLDEGGRLRHRFQAVPGQEQLLLLDDETHKTESEGNVYHKPLNNNPFGVSPKHNFNHNYVQILIFSKVLLSYFGQKY